MIGLGFYIVTFIPVLYSHMVKMATLGEFVDSVVSAAVFALVFTLGYRLIGRPRGLARRPAGDLGRGALTAVLVWALIIGFWLSVPDVWQVRYGLLPFFAHLLLFAASGAALAGWMGRGSGIAVSTTSQ